MAFPLRCSGVSQAGKCPEVPRGPLPGQGPLVFTMHNMLWSAAGAVLPLGKDEADAPAGYGIV
jgi:hypothetical protein